MKGTYIPYQFTSKNLKIEVSNAEQAILLYAKP